MRLAIVVPGGVDRSGEVRVIPAFVALIERLARCHEVEVFALRQQAEPGTWQLGGAIIHNAGARHALWRTLGAIGAAHRRAPFDVVQSLFSGGTGFAACLAAMRLRRPLAVHVAGGELVSLPQIDYGGRLNAGARCREAFVLRRAAVVSAASDPMIHALRALGIAARRIPLGVDLGRWPRREPAPRDPLAPARLVHIASLNRVKDPFTLLEAAALLARAGHAFTLDVVGEDTLGGTVQRRCDELGLQDCVRFLGFLRQSELHARVAAAHVCVMASLHEAGPMAALEAAVAGVPTVGTRVGHLEEWCPDAALAVPAGDAAALASAVAKLLADEALRLRLARAAQARALAEDADHTARAFDGMYRQLLHSRAAAA